jgi:hypothetical protein
MDETDCDEGKDLINKPTKSLDECCNWCNEITLCRAFTWVKDAAIDPNHGCYLKTDCGLQTKQKKGVISGKSTKPGPAPPAPSTCDAIVMDDTNCDDGESIENKPVNSQDECCKWCMDTEHCTAWTWNKDKTLDPHQKCFLKTDCNSQTRKKGVVSGRASSGLQDKMIVV